MTKKSKILYLVTQAEWGGAQRYIFDLATNLPKDRFEVIIACGSYSGEFPKNNSLLIKVDEQNIKSYRVKNLVRNLRPVKDFLAYLELKKLIKEINPDILHLNSSKAGVLGSMAGKKAGVKKIIYTVHGFVFTQPVPSVVKKFYIWAEKTTARHKTKFICISEDDRSSGLKKSIAPADKFAVIY